MLMQAEPQTTRAHDRAAPTERATVIVERQPQPQGTGMRVLLVGATGMIGGSVLRECLLDAGVKTVLAVGHRPSGVSHPKLRELVLSHMSDRATVTRQLSGHDACFFCPDASSVDRANGQEDPMTHGLTLEWARTIGQSNPGIRFLYVSGFGTVGRPRGAKAEDSVEKELLTILPSAAVIRPSILRPMNGETPRSHRAALALKAVAPAWPLISLLGPACVVTSEELGRAMILIAMASGARRIFGNASLVRLGRAGTVYRKAA